METTKMVSVQPAFKFNCTKMALQRIKWAELSAANDWKGAVENNDAKAAGKAITYTVKEVAVPDGY